MEANHAIAHRIVFVRGGMLPRGFRGGCAAQWERTYEHVAWRATRSHACHDFAADGSDVHGKPSAARCSANICSTERSHSAACRCGDESSKLCAGILWRLLVARQLEPVAAPRTDPIGPAANHARAI
jgi:hypothetical protein